MTAEIHEKYLTSERRGVWSQITSDFGSAPDWLSSKHWLVEARCYTSLTVNRITERSNMHA